MEVGVDETLDGDLQGRVLEPRGACADRREVVVGGVEEVGLVTGERAYAFEGARGKRGLQRVIRELELQAASHLRDLLGRGGGVQLGILEALDGCLHRHIVLVQGGLKVPVLQCGTWSVVSSSTGQALPPTRDRCKSGDV